MAQGTSFNMEEEFAGLDFHSIRIEERFVRTMETLIQQPDASIWEASKDRAEAKAIYRMLGKVRPIEEKESFRWLETLERSTADMPEGVEVITVCDREGDMAD